jgi:septation ring formation regulator EzrA
MRYKGLFEQKLQQLTNQLTGIHSSTSRGDMLRTRELIENAKERIEEMQTLLNNEHQE